VRCPLRERWPDRPAGLTKPDAGTGRERAGEEPAARAGGVHEVRELRIRWIGHTLRAEADITVDPYLTVHQAHDMAHRAEEHLIVDVRRLTAATVHVSPAGAHPR
jgi:divalent metal cation (Fe/Co/Zn/Cd) transporter